MYEKIYEEDILPESYCGFRALIRRLEEGVSLTETSFTLHLTHFLLLLAATASTTKVLCSYFDWRHCLSKCLNCRRQFSVSEMDGITAYQSVLTAVGSFRFLRWVASMRQLASLSIKVS